MLCTVREDLLHFIWKHRKLPSDGLTTSENERISILETGVHNPYGGPDFFNARIRINDQVWAGNVEIHVKASDWYRHGHEKDVNYNNVILHVVWEDDVPVLRSNGSCVATLPLGKYISPKTLETYQNLFDKKGGRFINCENELKEIDMFILKNWLERLYFERLEKKSELILELLEESKNDWEKVLFTLLLKNFGLNINGDSFLSIARSLDSSIIRKVQTNLLQIEAIFFGLAGFLSNENIHDAYYLDLKNEYAFLKNKFKFGEMAIQKPDFFKLRPLNFPTIRLSQLANVLVRNAKLFDNLVNAATPEEIYTVLNVGASPYWDNHYTFGKISRKSKKKLSKKFLDVLIINTIIPLKFCYAKHLGKDTDEQIIRMASLVKKEENSLIKNFERLGAPLENARDGQAVLTLYKDYCTQNKCLQCAVGSILLTRNI